MSFTSLLERAIMARRHLFDDRHETAIRLFNGHLEGCPTLVIDLYGKTVMLHNYANPPNEGQAVVADAQAIVQHRLPWVDSVFVKARHGRTDEAKRGQLVQGTTTVRWIREQGVRYAIDVWLNQDASFYLDTRNLRSWLMESMADKTVLNTFAYTGSLGVAAQAGRAKRVVQTDLNRRFLNVAKTSYSLNGFPIDKRDFHGADFWSYIKRLKRSGERFDCLILDPPFFSTTAQGTLNLAQDTARLINKVRPVVKHGGQIIMVNNSLYLSGRAYLTTLESLCQDNYLAIKTLIPVPDDCLGYEQTRLTPPVTNPAPFNHSTKIAVLTVNHHPKSRLAVNLAVTQTCGNS